MCVCVCVRVRVYVCTCAPFLLQFWPGLAETGATSRYGNTLSGRWFLCSGFATSAQPNQVCTSEQGQGEAAHAGRNQGGGRTRGGGLGGKPKADVALLRHASKHTNHSALDQWGGGGTSKHTNGGTRTSKHTNGGTRTRVRTSAGEVQARDTRSIHLTRCKTCGSMVQVKVEIGLRSSTASSSAARVYLAAC